MSQVWTARVSYAQPISQDEGWLEKYQFSLIDSDKPLSLREGGRGQQTTVPQTLQNIFDVEDGISGKASAWEHWGSFRKIYTPDEHTCVPYNRRGRRCGSSWKLYLYKGKVRKCDQLPAV